LSRISRTLEVNKLVQQRTAATEKRLSAYLSIVCARNLEFCMSFHYAVCYLENFRNDEMIEPAALKQQIAGISCPRSALTVTLTCFFPVFKSVLDGHFVEVCHQFHPYCRDLYFVLLRKF
jgi:hypothetical protein